MEGVKAGNSNRNKRGATDQQTDGSGGRKRKNVPSQSVDTAHQQQQQLASEFRPTSTVNVPQQQQQQPHPQSEQRAMNQVHGSAAGGDIAILVAGQQQQQFQPAHVSISYSKPFVFDQQQQQQQQQIIQPSVLVVQQQQNGQQEVAERIRRRQLAELTAMEAAKPLPEDVQFCAELNCHGLTDIGFLLLGWKDQMVISRLTGVVTQSCAMGGPNAKFRGRKVVLQFDRECSQLLSVKEWDRSDGRPSELAKAQPGDRIFLQRLNVTQGKGTTTTTLENTFLFSLTFGAFSKLQILAHAGHEWEANARVRVGASNILAITGEEEVQVIETGHLAQNKFGGDGIGDLSDEENDLGDFIETGNSNHTVS